MQGADYTEPSPLRGSMHAPVWICLQEHQPKSQPGLSWTQTALKFDQPSESLCEVLFMIMRQGEVR